MSIYSGFATRNLEQTYDQCVSDLLFVLQKRILKFYNNAETDQQKFWTIFSQLYHQIVHLEKCKYLEPKSSIFVTQMFEYLKQKKQERVQDPQEDLKKFQRSLAIKVKRQQDQKAKQTQINNFIKRSSFSFGKIKRQLDPGKIINMSGESFPKKGESANNSYDSKFEGILQNPEQRKLIKQKRIFSSKGVRNTKSFHEQTGQSMNKNKIKIIGGHPVEEVVIQYLQKTNKNYLRGYRKRKIKQDYNLTQAPVSHIKH